MLNSHYKRWPFITISLFHGNAVNVAMNGRHRPTIVLQAADAQRVRIIVLWDTERNGSTTAYDVSPYDNRDYFWICEKGHSWPASPANRNNGTGCPYCSHKLPVVGENDLLTLYPDLCKEWHPKNEKMPSEYLPQSHESVQWLCSNGHKYSAKIYMRVNGSGCPKCLKRKSPTRKRI